MLKILYLDHEGGWGGASRSLFYLVSNLDRAQVSPEVWHRQAGPATKRLKQYSLPSRLVPDLPNLTPRAARHPANWISNGPRLVGMRQIAKAIATTDADVIHFNYEGLAPLALALDQIGDRRPRVLHVRVMNPVNALTKAFVRYLSPRFNHTIFISNNERDNFVSSGYSLENSHSVMYNPVDRDLLYTENNLEIGPPFRVSFFGTLDHLRGADRLIEVAQILKSRGASAIIDLFGRGPQYRKLLLLKRKSEDELRAKIRNAGVEDIVRVRGHSSKPEIEIERSHLVVRPSRGADPWGRDVIETMSLGRPVLATGNFDGFVVNGETGYLLERWDAVAVADIVEKLARNYEHVLTLGTNARNRARRLFDPVQYASEITRLYSDLAAASR
ncbi:glycosyltransferase [Tardiphaga alba]|uniref:Glycosyltransferase n=1 Tax=Tardiphaga alba TaxID=340268 RepID=A0ABX8A5Y0_9BRAD|nr:glycosyltransferase family 4 protein [Tardiphaga alba]QUS39099.1 glycosyltransferase [Tardiphaga alba]